MDQFKKREIKSGTHSGFMIYSPTLKKPIGVVCGTAAEAVIRGMKLVAIHSHANFRLAGYHLISVKMSWWEVVKREG